MKNSLCFVLLNTCLLLLIIGCSKEDTELKKDVSELTPNENKQRLERIGTQLLLKVNPLGQKELLEAIDAFTVLGGKEYIQDAGYAYALHQYTKEMGWKRMKEHDCLEYHYPVGKKNASLVVSFSDERCMVYGRELPSKIHSTILVDSKKRGTLNLTLQRNDAINDIVVTGTIHANQCIFHLSATLSEQTTSVFSLWLESDKEKLLTLSGTADVSESHHLECGKIHLNILDQVCADFSVEKLSEMRENIKMIGGQAGTQDYCQKVSDIYNQYIEGSYHYTESDYIVANIEFQPFVSSENNEEWDVESVMCFMYDQSRYSLDSYLGINLISWITKACGSQLY